MFLYNGRIIMMMHCGKQLSLYLYSVIYGTFLISSFLWIQKICMEYNMQCSRTVLLLLVCYSKHCVWYGLLFVVAQAVWYWVWHQTSLTLSWRFISPSGVVCRNPCAVPCEGQFHHSSASDDNLATSQCLSSASPCPFYTAWCREHPSLIRTISYCIGNMLRNQ